MKTGITAHMIIKNEEQWVWYAIKSVIKYVERILIYDTGSNDKTVEIIKTIDNRKINFFQKGQVSSQKLVYLRNEQIKETKTPWFLLLDGDEVWPEEAIGELTTVIKSNPNIKGVVVKARIPVGDLFHYQPENVGRYQMLGKTGHYNLRAYKKKLSSGWKGIYPLEAYMDRQGVPIQSKDKELFLLKNEYWHLTHLKRSTIDTHHKIKYEIGEVQKTKLPEVFFKSRPQLVPSPWIGYTSLERMRAILFKPLLKLKRSVSI